MKNNNKHSTIYVTQSDHAKGAAAYNNKRPPSRAVVAFN